RQVARGDRRGHFGDVAHLTGEVRGHRVDVVREVLPRAADALDLRLAAKLALGAHFAGDASDLTGKGVKLVDHHVDGVPQLWTLSPYATVYRPRQVARGDGRGHFGDVAHLTGQVAGHQVHVVGEVRPRAADALDLRLAAKLAFRAHFAGDASHL